jgi:hypothetical protein
MYTSYASKQCDNLSQKELEKRLKKILGLNIKPKLKKKKGGRMTKPKYKSKKIKSKKIKTKKIKTYKSSEDLVPKSGTNKSACRLASEEKKIEEEEEEEEEVKDKFDSHELLIINFLKSF